MKKQFLKKGFLKKELYPKVSPDASKRAWVIGAAGAEKGCGATHFLWSAANYLSNVTGSRVAVCNLSGEADYGQAQVILGKAGDRTSLNGKFSYCRITFFGQADEDELVKQTGRYDCVLLDLGYDAEKYKRLLSRCDKRFLIGALNEWRCADFVTAALRLEALYGEGFTALSSFYSAKGIRRYNAAAQKEIMLLPYEPEPFCLHKDMLAFFDGAFPAGIFWKDGLSPYGAGGRRNTRTGRTKKYRKYKKYATAR